MLLPDDPDQHPLPPPAIEFAVEDLYPIRCSRRAGRLIHALRHQLGQGRNEMSPGLGKLPGPSMTGAKGSGYGEGAGAYWWLWANTNLPSLTGYRRADTMFLESCCDAGDGK